MLQSLGLTPREAEILFWVSQGKTNPEICTILEMKLFTVKKHLENIYAKLGVENRTAACAVALEKLG
jgi:DNA-binding CsgD family transcriptional regulator